MILTGRMVAAEEALGMGLLNEIVEPGAISSARSSSPRPSS